MRPTGMDDIIARRREDGQRVSRGSIPDMAENAEYEMTPGFSPWRHTHHLFPVSFSGAAWQRSYRCE